MLLQSHSRLRASPHVRSVYEVLEGIEDTKCAKGGTSGKSCPASGLGRDHRTYTRGDFPKDLTEKASWTSVWSRGLCQIKWRLDAGSMPSTRFARVDLSSVATSPSFGRLWDRPWMCFGTNSRKSLELGGLIFPSCLGFHLGFSQDTGPLKLVCLSFCPPSKPPATRPFISASAFVFR